MTEKPIHCAHCTRRFIDGNGLWMHMKAKHPKEKRADLRSEREESFADMAVEAEINRRMGIYDGDTDWLLP